MLRFLTEWRDRARTLRDAQKFQDQDRRNAQQKAGECIRAGRQAFQSGDHKAALSRWQEARAHYPDATMESRDGLGLLLNLGQFDVAEALMQEGSKRQPRNPFFLEGAARVATKRGDHEESTRRYAMLRKKFPHVEEGYTDGTIPLIKLGRLDEADRILGLIASKPRDNTLEIRHARLAMTRKDWLVALARWQTIMGKGGREAGPLGIAQCLRELGRFNEAEQILTSALKVPRQNALDCRVEMARIAESRGDWADAALRWDIVRMSAPSLLDGYCRTSLALAKCGKELEAETILHEATLRFPAQPQPWIDYAKAADLRGDADEAATRWEQVRVRFPNQAMRP